ncbi:hypothetical protein LRS06_09420 [Hymenobacter sp. J193]|uniref:hypothetical protein n=1 Tax=Hymenobacter sp. J193 TaxID=2898429 RepID=UPI0021509010|nr:hypothetical protein [Hymenobacter sp. J193]MCR5887995.1 hypothetical protein [Hymenobacter sp. J193]
MSSKAVTATAGMPWKLVLDHVDAHPVAHRGQHNVEAVPGIALAGGRGRAAAAAQGNQHNSTQQAHSNTRQPKAGNALPKK